jgi:hypothetical protein
LPADLAALTMPFVQPLTEPEIRAAFVKAAKVRPSG